MNKSKQYSPKSNNDDVFVWMDVSKATDVVSSDSSYNTDNELCLAITQALKGTLVTNRDKNKQPDISASGKSTDA
jgi:hypothetical protein